MHVDNNIDPQVFSGILYEKMQHIHPGIADLELYEFRYCLETVVPPEGWDTVSLDTMEVIEKRVNDRRYYLSIQLKPVRDKRIVWDEQILRLLRMLMVGLTNSDYPVEWINQHFYFDLRGFYFLHKTEYFTPEIQARLGGKPYRCFEPKQSELAHLPSLGYKAFKEANSEIDNCFIDIVSKLISLKGTPILIAIAGQTAAGKTEIVSRLKEVFKDSGESVTSIELDNFFTDRDYREANGIDSLGKEAFHYDMLIQCLLDICAGKKISTPRYDTISATSSHDLKGKLREGCDPVEIEPADIIFMEGNFPFLLPDIAHMIGVKVVYLTDDAVRLKRKWRRDMDYRKKYELKYFLNRYFREQFLMAESAYMPQMQLCDLIVDTTKAEIWVDPPIARILE